MWERDEGEREPVLVLRSCFSVQISYKDFIAFLCTLAMQLKARKKNRKSKPGSHFLQSLDLSQYYIARDKKNICIYTRTPLYTHTNIHVLPTYPQVRTGICAHIRARAHVYVNKPLCNHICLLEIVKKKVRCLAESSFTLKHFGVDICQ